MHIPSILFALFLTNASSCTSAAQETPAQPAVQLAQYPSAPFEDRNGTLWFSTVQKGLIRYDGKEFVTFTQKDGLGANLIRGLVEDDAGTLWIATNGGVSTYDGRSFKTLLDYGDLTVTRTFTQEGDHRDIWGLLIDRKEQLWVASLDGVFRFDGTSFTPFPLPVTAGPGAFEFTSKMVYTIYEDSGGALWFGTDGAGAVRYDGETFTVYTEKGDGLCSDRVCEILEDSRGVMWFGTSGGGVSQYKDGQFTTHLRSPAFSKHTGWGRYMAIYEDKAGYVWFGASMAGGGAYRYDGETFRYYSTEDGLGTGGIPSIREDRSGNLWFGTTSGVFRFDGERFVNFTKRD